MNLDHLELFSEKALPATDDSIKEVESLLNVVIPNVYCKFLKIMDGACLNYAHLYSLDGLAEMNQVYEVQEYAPQYVSIGNDGGGNQLLMKSEKETLEFFLVDDGHMQVEEDDIPYNFLQWVQEGCPSLTI